ncbi:unnamed protein product [Hanseniaspora opuntiae]
MSMKYTSMGSKSHYLCGTLPDKKNMKTSVLCHTATPMSYCFVFSIDSRDSLENIETKWKEEVEIFGEKNADIVLMALKCDLRQLENKNNNIVNPSTIRNSTTNTQRKYISYEEGLQVAKNIGAVRYLECSAKLNKGVNEAFTEVSRVGMEQVQKNNLDTGEVTPKTKTSCNIM